MLPQKVLVLVGAALACCAGMVNAISFKQLGFFVSHVSGTVTRIGMQSQTLSMYPGSVESWISCLTFVGLCASFIFGAMLCGIFAGRNDLHEVKIGNTLYGATLIGTALLLVVTDLLANTSVAKYVAAAACGLQNGMCTMHLGAICRTTHVTGLATDLGTHYGRLFALMLRTRFWRRAEIFDLAETELVINKLGIYHQLGFGFVLGAYLGAWCAHLFAEMAYLVPAAVCASIGIMYLVFKERMRKASARWEGAVSLKSEHCTDVQRLLARTCSLLTEFERNSVNNTEVEHVVGILEAVKLKLTQRYVLKTVKSSAPAQV